MQAAEAESVEAHQVVAERREASAAADERLATLTREMATHAANRQRLAGLLSEERRRLADITARHAKTQAEAAALADDAHQTAIGTLKSKVETESTAVADLETLTRIYERVLASWPAT